MTAAAKKGVQIVQREAAGEIVLKILDPAVDATSVALRTADGDEDAARDLQILGWMSDRKPLRDKNYVVATALARDDATKAIGFSFCRACSATHEETIRRALTALRAAWGSDAGARVFVRRRQS